MKFVRFCCQNSISFGVIEDGLVWELKGEPYESAEKKGCSFPLSEVRLAAPVVPQKIIGIGLNYMDHITSQGLSVPTEPYIVHRPLNTLNCSGSDIFIRPEHKAQFEGELAIVIGRRCRNVSHEQAKDYIFGYTIGNDVTEKAFFRRDGHFGAAKAFDTQCPIGPWIVAGYDYRGKNIRTVVNGVERQNGNTDSMVFDCETLVSHLSGFMTLMPGDIILTGSPAGVGRLSGGDTVEVFIEGIGVLSNSIKDMGNSLKSEG